MDRAETMEGLWDSLLSVREGNEAERQQRNRNKNVTYIPDPFNPNNTTYDRAREMASAKAQRDATAARNAPEPARVPVHELAKTFDDRTAKYAAEQQRINIAAENAAASRRVEQNVQDAERRSKNTLINVVDSPDEKIELEDLMFKLARVDKAAFSMTLINVRDLASLPRDRRTAENMAELQWQIKVARECLKSLSSRLDSMYAKASAQKGDHFYKDPDNQKIYDLGTLGPADDAPLQLMRQRVVQLRTAVDKSAERVSL